ncbi:MAG: hypothetical protein ABI639_10500 [Thermoanaerobaculia bacterium]
MNPEALARPAGTAIARAFRLAFRLTIGACLALSAVTFIPKILYLQPLLAAPDTAARGTLAADERVSPFAAAGQVKWRREIALRRAAGKDAPSGQALAWRFFFDHRSEIPPGSRVFLARANEALYQYGNAIWFPSRLEVAPHSEVPLADGEDLRREAAHRTCAETDWLRAQGYSACVDAVGAELRLVRVAEEP